jgi:2-iminobutanoate/2-iminopropanoate deaminase
VIKSISLLTRKEGLTHEQFMKHWVEIHAPLAHAVPGLRRYVQSHIVAERTRPDIPTTAVDVDGIAELWYDDRATMERALASAAAQALHADGALFIGRIKTFVVEEKVVVPVAEAGRAKQVIHTDKVPPARVPLSQAIKLGDWIFASGQLGNDPKTGRLAEGGIAAETRQVCENLKVILEAAGSSLDRVVKVTIYMVDLGEVLAMNEIFSQYFPKDPPARTTFECSRLVGNARVEIEAIATAGPTPP